MMRTFLVRTAGLVAVALASATAVSAQATGTVTGTVTAANTRQPLSGAQVYVPGTQLGMLSDANGRFILLNVPTGQRRVSVQLLGYATVSKTVTVSAGSTTTVNFALSEQALQVQGLVVTALGIKRAQRSLGYAVQGVSDSVLQASPQTNLVEALQGQTAGVEVVQSSGRPGASSRITIRGESSFTGGGQPLFIIDGVPVSTALDNATGLSPLGSGSAGNRAMDFDMEDVASVQVLRGAAATALYGSRAAAGAVIITTKQGKAGSPLRFEFSSSASFDNAIIGGYTTNWAGGTDRMFCNGHPANDGGWCEPGYPGGTAPDLTALLDWGPNKDSLSAAVLQHEGNVTFQDARKAYYQTAQSTENSLRAMGSMGQMGTYTFGISYTNQGDINPVGKLQRLVLSAHVDLNMSSYLHSTTSIQRIHSYNPWSPDSWGGIDHTLKNIPPNVNYSGDQFHADGTPVMWGNNDPSVGWVLANNYYKSTTDRWILSQRFRVDVHPGWSLTNTWGLDTYGDLRDQVNGYRPWQAAVGLTSGGTNQSKITRSQINDDLILSAQPIKIGQTGLSVSGLVGGNVFMEQDDNISGRCSDINIPDYYNCSNFQTQRLTANLPSKQRLLGAYAQLEFGYHDWGFLTFTGRNDWSSTLPTNNNNYFYPSASLGVVFTDALNFHPSWMPYGKLRMSVAKVGNDAPPYSLSSRYYSASAPGQDNAIDQFAPGLSFPFRGQVGFFQGTQLGNPNIKPESTIEQEIGLDLRLFQNRWTFDGSFYNKKSYDQIFTVPSSPSTGYTNIVRNAGDLRNRGVELSLAGTVLHFGGFSWDTRINWSRNRNTVLSLAPGVTSINLAGYSWPSIRIMADAGYGVAWGYGWQRNCDPQTSTVCFSNKPKGALLIGDQSCVDADTHTSCYGLPIRTEGQINLGNVQPEWLGNTTNTFRYKNFSLSGMIDIRHGSRILNFETQYESGRNGRSFITADRYSTTVVKGIMVNDGSANTVVTTKTPTWYEVMYGYDKHENQMEPGGFVMLRSVTLSYDLPRSTLSGVGLDGATVYVTGRNLWIQSKFSQIDPEGDLYGGGNSLGQYFWQFPAPQTKGFEVGLRASF